MKIEGAKMNVRFLFIITFKLNYDTIVQPNFVEIPEKKAGLGNEMLIDVKNDFERMPTAIERVVVAQLISFADLFDQGQTQSDRIGSEAVFAEAFP
jgi:hypothetical protein